MQWMGCIILATCLGACKDGENTVPAKQSGEAPLELTLKLPSLKEAESRAAGTPQLSGIDFHDVWVLQYNDAETHLLNAKYYAASDISADESSSDFLVIVPTGSGGTSYFTNENSHFYTFVNGGPALFGTLTEEQLADAKTALQPSYDTASALKSLLQATPGSSKTFIDDPGLLIDGPISFSKTEGADPQIAIRANLSRTYACIRLAYEQTKPEDGKFTPTEAVVVNLPTHLSLFTREGVTTGVYPAIGEAATGANRVTAKGTENALFSATTTPELPWTEKSFLTFYMGENLRGTGTSTTYQGKNVAVQGPSGTLDGCTYLIIRGTYQYRIGTDTDSTTPIYSTDGISVEYRFYLGGNLTNDYNIQRNMRYTVTLRISGANSADMRVTITDSNVIVFDDSETIENEVTL